jgi:hypothetical protein
MGKKQHFVPQFLLRRFSSDPSKKRISLFYLPTSQVIINSSLKGQAYKKNIYGSDQIIEKYLWQIETRANSIINKIILSETICLTPAEEILLKNFINLQISRTPGKIATVQKEFDKMTKLIFRHDPRVKGFIDDFTIELKSPYHFVIGIALQVTPVLFDLKVSLLKNDTNQALLLGQHPAIVTNPFLYEKKWIGSRQGVGSKGALILLPISPSHAIALYDRKRYGLRDFTPTGILSQNDVNIINLFQFSYTTDCIYFYDGGGNIDFNGYKNATEEFRTKDKTIVKAYKGKKRKDDSTYYYADGKDIYLKGYEVRNKTLAMGETSQEKIQKHLESELLMSTTEEPRIVPKFDFISLKVRTIFEDLGPTMDISREGVMDVIEEVRALTNTKKDLIRR